MKVFIYNLLGFFPPCIKFRAVGRPENLGVPVVVSIICTPGLTDLSKFGGAPPAPTGLLLQPERKETHTKV